MSAKLYYSFKFVYLYSLWFQDKNRLYRPEQGPSLMVRHCTNICDQVIKVPGDFVGQPSVNKANTKVWPQ